MKDCNPRYYRRARRFNNHHIKNKCKGGNGNKHNLIRMDENRHAAFHLIFSNHTFLEAAKLLVRAHNIKTGTKHRVI